MILKALVWEKNFWENFKIILLGIISIVCIARTSGKTESGPHTTMKSRSLAS